MRKAATNSRQLIVRSYRCARIVAMLALLLAPSSALASETTDSEELVALLAGVEERLFPGARPEALRALRIEGVVEMGGAAVGSVETLATRTPRSIRETLELSGARQVTTVLGEAGWIEDANGAVRPASGDELTTLVLGHHLLFHRYLDGATPEFGLRARGSSIAIDPNRGLERTLEISDDLLPRRLLMSQHGTDVAVSFDDWRLVEGIRFPFLTVQSTGDARFEVIIRTTSVELLDEIAPLEPPEIGGTDDSSIVDARAAGDIPFRTSANLVFVDVQINGKRNGSFLLDTGAGATVLSSRLVAQLGIVGRGRMEARGAGGSEAASLVDVAELRLPGVVLRDQTLVAMSLDKVSATLGRRVDGILGYDFISRFALEIDYPRRRISIAPPGSYRPSGEALRVPIRIEANVPRVEGIVEGEHRGSFLLDTGNSRALILHSPFVKRHSLHERSSEPAAIAGIAGTETLRAVRIDSLSLGETSFHDVEALISTSDEGIAAIGEAIGNVGSGLFREGVLAVDYSEGALWVTTPVAASASRR